jgi:Leucine-rich repeat (LRR) protein
MADMTQLRRLWIGRTSFEYAGIPTHINGMTNMRELDVSNTNTDFSRGPIRHEAFVDLHHLYYLDLGGNVYTSTLPDSIVNLPNLEYLYLDNVVFGAGAKQSLVFLTKMPQIFECWLDHTELNGGIPTLIGQLSTLASFSASFCSLTGTLPTELGDLTAMDRMWLHQNKLAGTVPAQLSRLNSQYLTLEGNLLQGTLSACPSRVLQLGADCSATVDCPCCSCCEGDACGDFTPLLED